MRRRSATVVRADEFFGPDSDQVFVRDPEKAISLLEPFVTDERRARLQQVIALRLASVTVVMDAPHDPHNGAAVVRSCDGFGVQKLHMIERYSVSADGMNLLAEVTYDDPKAYTSQWKALFRYRRGRDLPVEVACAESATDPVTGELNPIPIAAKPDF